MNKFLTVARDALLCQPAILPGTRSHARMPPRASHDHAPSPRAPQPPKPDVLPRSAQISLNLLIWDKHASAVGIGGLCVCLLGGSLYRQSPLRVDAVRCKRRCGREGCVAAGLQKGRWCSGVKVRGYRQGMVAGVQVSTECGAHGPVECSVGRLVSTSCRAPRRPNFQRSRIVSAGSSRWSSSVARGFSKRSTRRALLQSLQCRPSTSSQSAATHRTLEVFCNQPRALRCGRGGLSRARRAAETGAHGGG